MTAATAASKTVPSAIEIEGVAISGCPTQFPSIHIESEAVLIGSSATATRTVRYTSTSTHVKRSADGSIRVTPSQKDYLLQVPTQRPGAVGLMLVGWGGNNGSTLTASLLAHQHNVTWKSRRGVETPNFYGSLVMASTCALGFDQESGKEVTAPIYQLAPFVDPKNLVVGGWDISSMNLADACDRAQVLEPTLIERLTPQMAALKPLPSIYDPAFIASNQSDRADNVIPGSKREQLEQVRKDIREFKEKNSLEEVIILWTANTERYTAIQSGVHDTWTNLDAAITANNFEISPSTLFAVASILEGVPFINGSPQNTFVPAVIGLASLKGVSIGGDDFKSGQTKMKSVLTDFLVSSGIKPVSIVSYNHLGNNDGKNLVEEAQFKSKEISKSGVVDDIIQSNPILYPIEKGQTAPKNPDHVIIIEYVPAVGDSKRAMDEYESEIFMGGRSTISIHNVCEDSLLAAPLMLDLILFTQFLSKIRIARSTASTEPAFEPFHPILSILSFLLKAPLVPSHAPIVNALMKQRKAIEGLLRACVGLPAVDDLVLEQRIRQ